MAIDYTFGGKYDTKALKTKMFSLDPHSRRGKYILLPYDGKGKHKDGSPFIGISISKTKKELAYKTVEFYKKGYIHVTNVYNALETDPYKMKDESVNEGKFKVDDLVYNKRTKTVGIVRIGDDKYGEVKTDADGNVDVDELEKYNPIKFKHQSKAKAAPSTQKEVSKRGLFNPFKNESVVNEGYGPFIKVKNLSDIIVLSKKKKNATFYVTDDNNSRIGTFYLKNGKFAKATTANPNYDFQRNKTNLKDRSDVIYKYKVDESVDEATRGQIHKAAKKGSYPVSLVVVKDGKVINQVLNIQTPQEVPAAFNVVKNYHKHKGAIVHIEDKTGKRLFSESESVNEAKKFSVKKLRDDYYPYGLYYDNRLVSGLKSNSKKEVENAIKSISKAMGIKESVNEISRLSMGIAGLTGTRGSAVEKFIKDYNLNDKELFKFLKKGKLKDRLDFATALSGRPGNKYQGDFVGAFGEGVEESVNEASMDWEKNFKWANDKELKVISKFIFMNDRGIDGVIKMSKHKPFAFRRTIQKMAKKGLHEAKVETERYFGKKGIIIMIRDGNKLVSAIFKNSKNADKFNRNNPSDVKKLLQLAKKTKYPKAIDESVNEASTINKQRAGAELKQKLKGKRSDGLGKYTATIYGLDSKGKRVELKSLNDLNKYSKFEIDESIDEGMFSAIDQIRQDSKDVRDFIKNVFADRDFKKMKNDKEFIKYLKSIYEGIVNESKSSESRMMSKIKKQVKGNEKHFYDYLSIIEKKQGRMKYQQILGKALRGFGVNPTKYKSIPDAEEKIFELA